MLNNFQHPRWIAAAFVGAALAAAPATAHAATSMTFNYIGTYSQVFQVPPAVTSIHVIARGGDGGSGAGDVIWSSGGAGATVTADVPVTAGELLDVWVGEQGEDSSLNGFAGVGGTASGAPGAGGDGGDAPQAYSGAGGGGASELTDLGGNMILAAGGGGGGGGGGWSSGDPGANGGRAGAVAEDGSGDGGTGGGSSSPDGTTGGGPRDSYTDGGGGGGGGGYPTGGTGGFGGTLGAGGGGGGAGSSWIEPQASLDSAGPGGGGNGQVTISWMQPSPTVTLVSSKTVLTQGTSVTFTAKVTPPAGDPAASGSVTFVDTTTGQNLAVQPLSSTGVAKFSTSSLPRGTTTVYAAYSGDSIYQAANSGAIQVTVYNRVVSLSATTVKLSTPVGTTMQSTVTVTSTGLDPVKMGAITSSSAPFSVSPASTCLGAVLKPGASCSVVVAFQPTAAGTVQGRLTIKDNAFPTPQKVALTGVGQ